MMMSFLFTRCYATINSQRHKIKDILKGTSIPKQALVQGWIRSIRNHKKVIFLDINDGSTIKCLQIVVKPEMLKKEMNYGASVSAYGDVVETKLHKDKIEMLCSELTLLGTCDESYPFSKRDDRYFHNFRPHPHLRMKEDSMASVLRVRNTLEMEIHKYFQNKGFLHVHTPVLTSSDCEGAGAMFSVEMNDEGDIEELDDTSNDDNQCSDMHDADTQSSTTIKNETEETSNEKHFHGTPAYLTVSSQLHLEACSLGVGDVYTLNPAFRAERSITRKHLSEFRMLEVEVAFADKLEDITQLMEESIKSVLQATREKCELELDHFYKHQTYDHKKVIEDATTRDYVKLKYSDAVKILQENSADLKTKPPLWGDDLNTEQENFIVGHCGNLPVFVLDYPMHTKPFYMYANNGGVTVSAVDLLFPFCGELCGGSIREHRLDVLQKKLKELDMAEDYDWYLDLRRFGNIPHGGYGMGFDRLVRFILGIHNIRDAVPFPRTFGSCIL